MRKPFALELAVKAFRNGFVSVEIQFFGMLVSHVQILGQG